MCGSFQSELKQERNVRPEPLVELDVALPGRVPWVILLDRQRADVAPIVIGAELRQSYEVEIRYPFAPPSLL
jgi:hypothetical protein